MKSQPRPESVFTAPLAHAIASHTPHTLLKESKMSNLFDRLPLDVIDYVIRPFVGNDYFARIGMNFLLPPVDRQGSPLKRDAAKQLELSLASARLKPLLAEAAAGTAPTKAVAIGATFDFMAANPLILQHNRAFRDVVFIQATTFANPDCPQYALLEAVVAATLVAKAQRLLDLVTNLQGPFEQISTSCSDQKWSAVSGGAAPVIVDNSLLLAEAEAATALARRSTPHWRCISRRMRYRRGRWDSDDDDDDVDDDWEYGYFNDADRWVCIERESAWTPRSDEPEEQPRVSRRGTVMEADGWEKVVGRRR